MALIDIAEAARRTGLPASTLRYYEEKGLIASVARRGRRRRFEPSVLDRLALIALAQASGFSLAEIGETFLAGDSLRIDRARLLAKADELDRKIGRLKLVRDGLRHAAACPEPNQLECPRFRSALKLAATGTLPPLAPSPSTARRTPRRG
jgi:DNA-binding transcriptional MerR regulator